MKRKTKIICTIGPASDSSEILEKMILEGMDVARINFSHGDAESHKKTMKKIVDIREKLNLPVAILLDTKGPEIRTGDFVNGKVELIQGEKFTLTTKNILGDSKCASVTYKDICKDLLDSFPDYKNEERKILIDDGLIELVIDEILNDKINCTIKNGGIVSNKKGVNIPNCNISMPFISEKDENDLIFGVKNNIDFVAVSFTRTADDIRSIRKVLDSNGGKEINIIAKIENSQGIDNIDDIIDIADGIMIARGDMGVEIPFANLPAIQKMLIKKTMDSGKIVITATQMLQSMMENPRPTRAEVSDVANAIYDGTGAIMLSGETAAGDYPVESLETMVEIAKCAENDINYDGRFLDYSNNEGGDITNAISRATCSTAIDVKAAAIITITASGRTARMISRYRPSRPIYCCSVDEKVARRMSLVWGVRTLNVAEKLFKFSTESLFEMAIMGAEKEGLVNKGDIVVLTAGLPLGGQGTTNILKAQIVGE